jgi:hypothetical protein
MRTSKYITLLTIAAALLSSGVEAKKKPSKAQEPKPDHTWAAAGQWGVKPNRIVALVDLAAIKIGSEETTIMTAEGFPLPVRKSYIGVPIYIIYESKDKPDFSSYTIKNYCRETPATKIGDPFTFWRDNRKSNEASAIAYTLPKQTSDMLHNLVCGDAETVLKSGSIIGIDPQHSTVAYPNDLPWKLAWQDGVRPPYTNMPSREQQDTEYNALLAKAKDINAANAAQEEKLKGDLRRMDQEAALAKARPKSQLNLIFQAWLGKDEAYVQRSMGVVPDNAYNAAGGVRILSYDSRGNWGRVYTTTDENGNVINTTEENYTCNVTFKFQNNKMFDFAVVGNSCRDGEFKRP